MTFNIVTIKSTFWELSRTPLDITWTSSVRHLLLTVRKHMRRRLDLSKVFTVRWKRHTQMLEAKERQNPIQGTQKLDQEAEEGFGWPILKDFFHASIHTLIPKHIFKKDIDEVPLRDLSMFHYIHWQAFIQNLGQYFWSLCNFNWLSYFLDA